MRHLVAEDGTLKFGIYPEPIEHINYEDYRLESPMGWRIPNFIKRFRFQQFFFLGVIGPEFILGLAVVDLKYAANAFFYLCDRRQRRVTEVSRISLPGRHAYIEPYPDRLSAGFHSGPLEIKMNEGRFFAQAKGLSFSGELDLKTINPFRICTRSGYRGWTFKQCLTPIKLAGELVYQGQRLALASPAYQGLIDWSCGYMRRETFWNWSASAATLPDGRGLGFNFSCGTNETSFTENIFLVDNKTTKVDSVAFVYDRRHLHNPWRISSYDKKVDLVFHPENERGEKVNAGLIAARFTQLMGVYEGTLTADNGETITLKACPGWAEDHYAKW